MQIPIPIAIATCFIATGAMWFFSTRDDDFTTPPTTEQQKQTEEEWKSKNKQPETTAPLSSDLKANDPTTPQPKLKKSPETVTPTIKLPLGDLNLSPELSEYGTLGDHGTLAMIALATELESKQANQRALLAWERVLDTTKPDETQLKTAVSAIHRLSPEFSTWNTDPSSDITLTLNAGATTKDKITLQQSLNRTAETIAAASGYILRINTKITFGKGPPPETPRSPIAIWFTRSSGKSGTMRETPPYSFMTDPSQEEELTRQCEMAIYRMLRSYLADATNFTGLPENPEETDAKKLLSYYITRLMWRECANSLIDQPSE